MQINNSLFKVLFLGKRLLSHPVYARVQIQTNRQTKKEGKKSIKKIDKTLNVRVCVH